MKNQPAISYFRYSSPGQSLGNSISRQIELTRDFCKALGWDYTEISDPGLSGFHGAHRKRGALGVLLKDLEAGRIEKGTKLVIESLDRLSRETPFEHLGLALDVIRSGLHLVVLRGDGQADTYSSETLRREPHRMHTLIAEMQRAHDESEIKSRRALNNWKETVKKIQKRVPVPGRHPGWIVYDNGEFLFHSERKATVEKMVAARFDGNGLTKISRMLNDDSVPTWQSKSAGKWQDSMVKRILRHPALYGEYRFSRPVQGSVPEAVTNYYPAVMSHGDWLRLQKVMDGARKTGGGRNIRKVPNLFKDKLFCQCGHTLQIFGNSKDARYHKRYYYCKNARNSSDCNNKCFWPIDDFEQQVLGAIVEELQDKVSLVGDQQKLREQLTEKQNELVGEEEKKQIDEDRLSGAPKVVYEALCRQMVITADNISRLKNEICELEAEIANQSESSILERVERIHALTSTRTEDKARIELRRLVGNVVDRIVVQDCSPEWGGASIHAAGHEFVFIVQRKKVEAKL